ncbi:hypothetical protein MTO96_002266 [Rhipicephalus appendiculatus]
MDLPLGHDDGPGPVSGGQEDDTWPPSCRTPPLPFLRRTVAPLSTHVRRNKIVVKTPRQRRRQPRSATRSHDQRSARSDTGTETEHSAAARRSATALSSTPYRRRTLQETAVLGRRIAPPPPFTPLQTTKLRLSVAAGDQSRSAHPNQSSAHRFRQSDGDGARKNYSSFFGARLVSQRFMPR